MTGCATDVSMAKQIREQISREWIRDLELVSAENTELERHREDAVCLDKDTAERDRKMVFDHGEIVICRNLRGSEVTLLLLSLFSKHFLP